MCLLVIAGVSGNLSWVPTWPIWFRNLASATAAVVFVVVYVGVAAREREARQRVEQLSAEVAQLAAANERNRLAREIHDTLGHYLTVIHVQLEAARAVHRPRAGPRPAGDQPRAGAGEGRPDRRAPVREGAARRRARRRHRRTAGLARGLGARRDVPRRRSTIAGTPRPVSAAVALALHRTALEALTNVRRHAAASRRGVRARVPRRRPRAPAGR